MSASFPAICCYLLPILLRSLFLHYRWVPLPEENEAIILDIAFPASKVINDDKRVYLVLHGINGNSDEGYVVDFVSRQVDKGKYKHTITP